MRYYIAYDETCGGTIYGIGSTPEAAMHDATAWLDRRDLINRLEVTECTERLFRIVQQQGGDQMWDWVDDGLIAGYYGGV